METTTKRTYYDNGQIKTEYQVLDGKKHGKHILYHENGRIAIEANYFNGISHGVWREWYENGRLAEEGEYIDNEYHIKNFWIETGEQLLKDGSGKAIRKFGASDGDVYEQYFENGEFKGEKKIAGTEYGQFIPDDE